MEQTKKYNNLIYDVGLHKGEDTDFYLKKGFKVIAFEADPYLVSECRSRFKSEIENNELIIIEGAIIEFTPEKPKCNTIKFYRNKDVSVWGTVVREWASKNEYMGAANEIIEVPTVDFSECLRQYGIPHYIKIDIEGMDTVCLKALMPFEQKPDYISMESEKISFKKLKEELDLLTKLGYTKFQAINQANIAYQKEPDNSKEGHYIGYTFQNGSSGLFGSDLSYKWKDYKHIKKKYKLIFLGYQLFGDFSKLRSFSLGLRFLTYVNKLSKTAIPGWYDTHAKHMSVH